MERRNISSGSAWEPIVGYSRAVRVGRWVAVSGTAAADADGHVVSPGDAYAQTTYILRKIETALSQAGVGLKHVVRTRLFVTNVEKWRDIGRAHAEFFRDIRPATTMVQVSRLLDPGMLIEIEADAIAPEAKA